MDLIDKLTAIADGFRAGRGTTQAYTLDEMAELAAVPLGSGTAPEDLTAELTEQEALLAELRTTLEGKASGGGSGNVDVIAEIANGTITEAVSDNLITLNSMFSKNKVLKRVKLPNCVTASGQAFYQCTSLETIEMPNLEEITGSSFAEDCTSLISVSLPKLKSAGTSYSFCGCKKLKIVEFRALENIGSSAFNNCSGLEKADFYRLKSIQAASFSSCRKLQTVIIRAETMATLSSVYAFERTPIASGTGYIYVPASLVDSYKAATNGSTYAAQIRAIEDYPEITGG